VETKGTGRPKIEEEYNCDPATWHRVGWGSERVQFEGLEKAKGVGDVVEAKGG